MRTFSKSAALGLALLGLPLVACAEDYNMTSDGTCRNEVCNRKEGGEVRLEVVNKPDGTNFVRASAIFIESQDVDEYELATPHVCNFRLEDEFWPFAVSPGRIYADAGDEVRITGPSDSEFTLTRGSGMDYLARDHELSYSYTPSAERDDPVFSNGMYSVQLNGEGVYGELYPDSLFFPGNWAYVGDATHAPMTFNRGTDVLFEWTTEHWSNKPMLGFSDTMLLEFIDPDLGGPIVQCLTKFSNGNFTIPSEVYDAIPPAGLFLMGATSRHIVEMGDRHADFVGHNSKIQPYTVAAQQ